MLSIILLVIIFILNIIDYFQTIYGVKHIGLEVESNPIARFLLKHNLGWIPKFILVPASLIIMGILANIYKWTLWFILTLFGLYAYMVIYNFVMMHRAGILGHKRSDTTNKK